MRPSISNRVAVFFVTSLLLLTMSERLLATQPTWIVATPIVHAPDALDESDRWFFLPTPPVSLRRELVSQRVGEEDTMVDDTYVRPAWEMFAATVVVFVLCWANRGF